MRHVVVLILVCSLLGCHGGSSSNSVDRGPCTPFGTGQLRCSIEALADCGAIRDYPYARNLFCPAAFAAAQTMATQLSGDLGGAPPARALFYFYQTIADPEAAADDQSQTTIACLDTQAPWRGSHVVGAGAPLCRLIAYVTSPGPTSADDGRRGNPVPNELRAFPQYFAQLSAPDTSLPAEFQGGSSVDRIIGQLGAVGRDRFIRDYPAFSPDQLYDPADWQEGDPSYHGISGGGGGGWGGEIALERAGGDPSILLAFGGGGGGGMTSMRAFGVTSSRVGAGGGGGVQLADGYRVGDRSYNGLGLGAGVGSDEDAVEYSYFDYAESGRSRPVHDYNAAVIADYREHVRHLNEELRAGLARGDTVVLKGGGGMGAGTEYLLDNGQEATPHALSTQAGFQFRYEFRRRDKPDGTRPAPAATADVEADAEDVYALFGESYREATARAYDHCGRDYANYPCICPTAHAVVLCRVGRLLGDATKMPSWLQQPHCPRTAEGLDPQLDRLTSYQRFLLDRVSAAEPGDGNLVMQQPSCRDVLLAYFEVVNATAAASN